MNELAQPMDNGFSEQKTRTTVAVLIMKDIILK